MPWGVAAAGIGAAGSIASAAMSSPSQSSSGASGPWSVQQPYLQGGFQSASDIYTKQYGTPFYTGDLYAPTNSTQTGAMTGLTNFANGQGANAAGALYGAGSAALPGVANAASNAQAIYQRAATDPTQGIINSAGLYANNPSTAGMIRAANLPIQQMLTQQQLPGTEINAAGTGNTNSSRLGAQQAILQNDAAQEESANAANITGQQYDAGLNTAANLYNSGIYGSVMANNSGLYAGQAGAGLVGQGYNTSLNNLNIPLQVGTLQQQNQQGLDNEGYAQWQGQQQQPWSILNNYMQAVNGQYGNQTNSTSKFTPSGLQLGLSGAGTGIGLYNMATSGSGAPWAGNSLYGSAMNSFGLAGSGAPYDPGMMGPAMTPNVSQDGMGFYPGF